ncbi:hypothetical protein [Streptomyces sp. ME19-01-6]|uniref:hypothetical protein n=1 Tax=Streptomyces sp. ME19-01-6 TaxID=3028686 RepID=UPI0039F4775A
MGLHLLFQLGDLFVECDDQPGVGGGGGRVGGGDLLGQAELPLTQGGLNGGCFRIEWEAVCAVVAERKRSAPGRMLARKARLRRAGR